MIPENPFKSRLFKSSLSAFVGVTIVVVIIITASSYHLVNFKSSMKTVEKLTIYSIAILPRCNTVVHTALEA